MKCDDIQRILIIGSGTMGQQIGFVCALNGYDVVLHDISREMLDNGLASLKKRAQGIAAFQHGSAHSVEEALSRITLEEDAGRAARDVDLVSESIPEDPRLKAEVFARFDRLCKPETLFTTNTSSLLPSMFAQASGRPERLCALHFHDAAVSRIVDVMPHPGTSPGTTEQVIRFAESIGQVPILLQREHSGYVFNNMLMSLLDSSLSLAAGGVASVQDIDRSWMGVMHTPSGPFGIMDSIGLKTVWTITDYWAQVRNDDKARRNAGFVRSYIDQGKLGITSGCGFYSYPDPEFLKPGFITGTDPDNA